MSTIRELISEGRLQLAEMENPLLEVQILLSHVLNCDRVKCITDPDQMVSEPHAREYRQLLARRKRHEPIAYLVGHQEFWSQDFEVTQDTLIPRADTELLIEVVLQHLSVEALKIVDVGTGSGAIACTLAHMRPQWQLFATDISEKALMVAQRNATRLRLNNIQFLQTSWCIGLENQAIDAIVSNPPYIAENDPHLTQGSLPYEPQQALIGGKTGLEAYVVIIQQATLILKKGGVLAFEHGYNQGPAVAELLKQAGFHGVQTYTDLAGQLRVTSGVY